MVARVGRSAIGARSVSVRVATRRTCLWPPPASATWHCAHLVLKIFAPVKADIQDGNGGGELEYDRAGGIYARRP